MAGMQRSQFQEAREALARGQAEPTANEGPAPPMLARSEATQFQQAKEALARANQESQKENQAREGVAAPGTDAPGPGAEASQFKQAREALAKGREEASKDISREKPVAGKSESTQFRQAKEALARKDAEGPADEGGDDKATSSTHLVVRTESSQFAQAKDALAKERIAGLVGDAGEGGGAGPAPGSSGSRGGAAYQRQESTQFRQAKEALAKATEEMPKGGKKETAEPPASESTQFKEAKAALALWKQQASKEKEAEGAATKVVSSEATQFQQAKAALTKHHQHLREERERKAHRAARQEATQFKQAKAALNQWWTTYQADDQNSLEALRKRRLAYNACYKQGGATGLAGQPTVRQHTQDGSLSEEGEAARVEADKRQLHEATQAFEFGMLSKEEAVRQVLKIARPGAFQSSPGVPTSSSSLDSDAPRTHGFQAPAQLVRSLSEISAKELQGIAERKRQAPQVWDMNMLLTSEVISNVQESDISAALQVDAGEILRMHRQMQSDEGPTAAASKASANAGVSGTGASVFPDAASVTDTGAAGVGHSSPVADMARAVEGEGQQDWHSGEEVQALANEPGELPMRHVQRTYPPSTSGMFPFCTIL